MGSSWGIAFALVFALASGIGCRPGEAAATGVGGAASGDLSSLSDEFNDPGSLKNWQRIEQVEGWNNDQLEKFSIDPAGGGWLTMMPFTSTWYRDYRGILVFKPVSGDFVVTARLRTSGRSGSGPPQSQFSLAGIMVRRPRDITPDTWRPGGENYVFLSHGAADQPGRFQFEVKTTVNSDSQLATTPASSGEALVRVARIGPALILLKNEGGQWTLHRRYRRNDFPAELQVGLTCYTDWPNASRMGPPEQNRSVIRTGSPDLIARFDYVRFARPKVPSSLAGKALDDPGQASDAALLGFLGGE